MSNIVICVSISEEALPDFIDHMEEIPNLAWWFENEEVGIDVSSEV